MYIDLFFAVNIKNSEYRLLICYHKLLSQYLCYLLINIFLIFRNNGANQLAPSINQTITIALN